MKAVVTTEETLTFPASPDIEAFEQRDEIIPNYYAFRRDTEAHAVMLKFASADREIFPPERIQALKQGRLFTVEEIVKLNRDISRYVEKFLPEREPDNTAQSFDHQCQMLENLGFSSTGAIETLRAVRTPYFQRTDENWATLYQAADKLITNVSTEKIAV